MDVLSVTLVGDFVNFLRPNVLQNSRYFFVSYILYLHILLCPYFLFNHADISLYSEPLEMPFFSKFKLSDSILRNLV